jgi:hypothetical protein
VSPWWSVAVSTLSRWLHATAKMTNIEAAARELFLAFIASSHRAQRTVTPDNAKSHAQIQVGSERVNVELCSAV